MGVDLVWLSPTFSSSSPSMLTAVCVLAELNLEAGFSLDCLAQVQIWSLDPFCCLSYPIPSGGLCSLHLQDHSQRCSSGNHSIFVFPSFLLLPQRAEPELLPVACRGLLPYVRALRSSRRGAAFLPSHSSLVEGLALPLEADRVYKA